MENEPNNDNFDKDDFISILELNEINYDKKEDYFTFFLKLKSSIEKNLTLKRTTTLTSKMILILYCFQKISPKLPKLIIHYFKLKFKDNNIINIKRDIFDNIKETLENENSDSNSSESHLLKVKGDNNGELADCLIKCDEITSNIDDSDYDHDLKSDIFPPELNTSAKNSQNKLLKHESLLNNNQYYCNLCNKYFDTRIKLLSHRVNHKPQELGGYKCESCEKIFITKSALIKHKSAQHKQLYKCKICNIEMNNNRKFKIHVKVGFFLPEVKLLLNSLCLSSSRKNLNLLGFFLKMKVFLVYSFD